ncbi:MAG: glycosyltransferase [Planctomycetes bacterium]|nr:glycosyltransferase [Planctomycetota bacterium]
MIAPYSPARTSSTDSGRPVRVCFLIDRLSRAGTETQLLDLLRRLDHSRVEPFLCLLDGEDELSRSLEPDCCPVLRLGIRSLHHPRTVLRGVTFARFLRRARIDVLQVYFPDSTYFGVAVGRLAGVRRLVRTRFNLGYWMTPLHRRLGRICNRFTDAVVTNGEACRAAFIRDEGFPPSRTVVLGNGVDVARFPSRTRDSLPGVARLNPRIGVVANLRPVKGLEDFVQAASLLRPAYPGAVFEVAGEGELRPRLEQLAAELGLGESFHLLGSVSEIPEFLANLDVAVLCSHSEGMSNTLLEYMAAARPVVATAVGGNLELIQDRVNGLLAPPRDPAQLAGAIEMLSLDSNGYARQAVFPSPGLPSCPGVAHGSLASLPWELAARPPAPPSAVPAEPSSTRDADRRDGRPGRSLRTHERLRRPGRGRVGQILVRGLQSHRKSLP